MIFTRPEKSDAMSRLVQSLRDSIITSATEEGLNLPETLNATAHLVASILVGAYDKKNQEVVLSTFPDVVRAYFPQWEKIYSRSIQATPPAAHGTDSCKPER